MAKPELVMRGYQRSAILIFSQIVANFERVKTWH